jgi:two-component system, NarL family, invasion response regulator UvrY
MIRVMLCDDHALVRMGFRLLLQNAGDIEVVAEAESGEQARTLYRTHLPDVLVMDLALAGASGIETTMRLLAHFPQAKVLALSAHEDTSFVAQMLKAGARGYLSKRTAPETLVEAVRAIARGERYLDPTLAQRIDQSRLTEQARPFDALSEREFEVFIHLAQGLSVIRIAELLSLSGNTVGTHLYNIKRKLAVSNQAELSLMAMRHGLLDSGPGRP